MYPKCAFGSHFMEIQIVIKIMEKIKMKIKAAGTYKIKAENFAIKFFIDFLGQFELNNFKET